MSRDAVLAMLLLILPLLTGLLGMWLGRISAVDADNTWNAYAHDSARFSSKAYLRRESDRAATRNVMTIETYDCAPYYPLAFRE